MSGVKSGWSDNLGYQCQETLSRAAVRYMATRTVRWVPLVEACLDACCELVEGRCNRVSGSEAVLIFSCKRNSLIR